MATKSERPLLMDELNLVDKINLAQTSLTPGYPVLQKLMEAACAESRIAINDVNPEEPGYDQVLRARQQYSRAINKFCVLVLRSVEWHKQSAAAVEGQKESEIQAAIESQE